MCVSVPGQVTRVNGPMAEVQHGDATGWFNSLPVPGLQVGAWVFTQANLVVAEVSEAEARQAYEALMELQQALAIDSDNRKAYGD
jgi:hydrogenase maturation factor